MTIVLSALIGQPWTLPDGSSHDCCAAAECDAQDSHPFGSDTQGSDTRDNDAQDSDAQDSDRSDARPELPADRSDPRDGPAVIVTQQAAPAPVTAMQVSPSGRFLVTGSLAGLRVYSMPDITHVGDLPVDLQMIHDVRFSPDGDLLAVGGGTPGQFGIVDILQWDESKSVPRTALLHRISEQDDVVYAVAWSPRLNERRAHVPDTQAGTHGDAGWLAVASLDGTCLVVFTSQFAKGPSSKTSHPFLRIDGHSRGLTGAEFLQAGQQLQLITSSLDQTLRVWTVPNGELLRTLNNHTGPVTGVAVRPSLLLPGSSAPAAPPLLASIGDDRTIRFWQPTVGRMVSFHRFESAPSSMAWTSDGTTLLVGCRDGSIHRVQPAPLTVQQLTQPAADSRIHELVSANNDATIVAGFRDGLLVIHPGKR